MQMALEKPENGRATFRDVLHEGHNEIDTELKHHEIRTWRKLEDEHPPTRLPALQLPLSDENTCTRCVDLDLRGAIHKVAQIQDHDKETTKAELWHGIPIANVGRQYQHKSQMTNCALCHILCACRIDTGQNYIISEDGDELRLFRFLHFSHFIPNQRKLEDNSGFLVVVPAHFGSNKGEKSDYRLLGDYVQNEGTAVLLQDGGRLADLAAQEIPHSLNANIAKPWLDHCKSHHARSCGNSTTSAVSGLRLIDCVTLSIGEADHSSPYVALSYVWSKSGKVDSNSQHTSDGLSLPARMCPVISDTISVVKALGFQYLWVDRFCIDQNDAVTKHQQIKQMDAIYENAELTVIAAAGVDETYGLPGIGDRRRTTQSAAKFREMSAISMIKHPHSSIRSSRWASRGWTFQEALLSRRRLVFTDQHLYFECNSMYRVESVHNLLDELQIVDKKPGLLQILDDLRSGGPRRIGTDGVTSQTLSKKERTRMFGKPHAVSEEADYHVFEHYLQAIDDYSRRDLSYDADSLNAFQGIIQWYSKLKRPFNAIWGMPYPVRRWSRSSYFCFALAWSHAQSYWTSSRQPRRRPEFPSWTWAGWAGAVQIRQDIGEFTIDRGVKSIRFRNLGHIEEDLDGLEMTTLESNCRVLRLLAMALPPQLFSCKPTGDGKISWLFAEYKTTLCPSRESMFGAKFLEDLMDMEKWRCVWICSNAVLGVSYCLVLELNVDTGLWMRSGMFRIRCSDQQMRIKTEKEDATWFEVE